MRQKTYHLALVLAQSSSRNFQIHVFSLSLQRAPLSRALDRDSLALTGPLKLLRTQSIQNGNIHYLSSFSSDSIILQAQRTVHLSPLASFLGSFPVPPGKLCSCPIHFSSSSVSQSSPSLRLPHYLYSLLCPFSLSPGSVASQ